MRKSILDALFPKLRQEVLAAFLLQPEKWWYLSDLAHHLKVTPSSLQRELASLNQVQLLERRKEGNRIYYRANIILPGIEDIQGLLIKTKGIADVIRSALKGLLDRSKFAFIYGSLARSEEVATSDVDLMIIGDIRLKEVASFLTSLQDSLQREVNPTVYTAKEFLEKVRRNNTFVKMVLSNKKIFLKGTENELKALVGQT